MHLPLSRSRDLLVYLWYSRGSTRALQHTRLKLYHGTTAVVCLMLLTPLPKISAPPGWLSGERVGLKTRWLRVLSLVEATFLSGVFLPLTSAEACEKKVVGGFGKKSCVSTGVRKPGNTYASPTAMI